MSDTTHIIGIVIGIIILFALIVCMSIKAYYNIKRGKSGVELYLIFTFIVISTFLLSIFTFSFLYNYYFEKGANLVYKNKNYDAPRYLNKALKIRRIVGPLDTVFDKKVFGVPLFFSTEMFIHRCLANAYRVNGNYQKALEEYEQIESFYNNDFNVIAGIAYIYFMLNNIEMSVHYYEKLIIIKPDKKDVNYYFYMGMAYLVLMDCDSAEMYLKKSIELGKDSKGINRLIEKCKSGTIIDTGIYSREE